MKQLTLPFFEKLLFYSLLFFLPTQFGKHFWPEFSYVLGLRIDYLSPTLYFTDCLIILLFGTWLFRIVKKKRHGNSKLKTQNSKVQGKNKNYFKLSLIMISVFVISYLLVVIVFSHRILGGLYYLLKLLEMTFVAYYTAKFLASGNAIKTSTLVFAGAVFFQSLLAIAQFVHQGSIGGMLYFFGERSFTASTPGIANASLNGELVLRPYATLPHPNVLAGFLLICMTLILFSIHRAEQPLRKLFNYSALVLGSITLFLTLSRTAILLWILVVAFYIFKKAKKIYVAFVVFIMLLLFSLTPLGARFTGVNLADEAFSQRVVLADASFQMMREHPLFGVGLSNFIPTLAHIRQPLTVSTYLQPVHNVFLLVAAETGFIGLGFFLWFLWKTLQRIRNHELGIRDVLLILFSVILITGLFDHYWLTLQQGQLLFAFVIGLCYNSAHEKVRR